MGIAVVSTDAFADLVGSGSATLRLELGSHLEGGVAGPAVCGGTAGLSKKNSSCARGTFLNIPSKLMTGAVWLLL